MCICFTLVVLVLVNIFHSCRSRPCGAYIYTYVHIFLPFLHNRNYAAQTNYSSVYLQFSFWLLLLLLLFLYSYFCVIVLVFFLFSYYLSGWCHVWVMVHVVQCSCLQLIFSNVFFLLFWIPCKLQVSEGCRLPMSLLRACVWISVDFIL